MKDITQNIKINALTDKANSKLKQMKSTMLSMPKSLTIDNAKYNLALASMKTSLLGLAGVATTAFLALKKGFQGLALDLQSVNRLNTALESTGNTANISSQSLVKYFGLLLEGIGLSASDLTNLASRLISAGASSLSMVKQYTNAIVGIADKTGKSIDLIATKFIAAMNGKTKGLVDFGVAVDGSLSKQLMLNQALRNGQIAFDNIDPTSATRSLMILKLSWDNMILGLAAPMLPTINKIMQSIAKNALTIGRLLGSGLIISGLRYATIMGTGLLVMAKEEITYIKSKIALNTINNDKNLSMLMKVRVKSAQIKAEEQGIVFTQQMKLAVQNKFIQGQMKEVTLAQTIKGIVTSSNFLLLAGTIILGTVIANWDKIKKAVTGTSGLQKKLFLNAGKGFGLLLTSISKLAGSLAYYAKNTKLSNQQILHRNSLVKQYNDNYGTKYKSLLDALKLTTEGISDAVKNLTTDLNTLMQSKIRNAILDSNLEKITLLTDKYTAAKLKQNEQLAISKNIQGQIDNPPKIFVSTADLRVALNLSNAMVEKFKNNQIAIQKEIQLQSQLSIDIASELAPSLDIIPTPKGTGGIDKAKKSTLDLLQAQLSLAKTTTDYSDDLNVLNLILELNRRLLSAVKDNPNDPLASDIERLRIKTLLNNLYKERDELLDNQKIELKDEQLTILPLTSFRTDLFDLTPLYEFKKRIKDSFMSIKVDMIDIGNSILDSFGSVINNGFSQLGQAFANVLTEGANFGKLMKNIFKSMANSIIALLGRIIAKMLITFAIKQLLGLFTANISNIPDIIGVLPSYAGIGNSPSQTTTMTSSGPSSNLIYSSGNNFVNKLDQVIDAINNIQPVQTQVIDLPTLSKANRIGGAMILQGAY